ncbi:Splicing factor 3B subunit 4 [Linum perenne]
MSRSVYIGNLDERVSNRVLYDILIQAGRVVDLHIPRDRETDKPKGYAFAEYESEEVAEYAVKLFSGLVTLYNRTLRFKVRLIFFPEIPLSFFSFYSSLYPKFSTCYSCWGLLVL